MKIAVLGLGNMGSGIARNLISAGFPLTVYNRTRSKADGLGALVAASPAEAVKDCDVAITMLADDVAVLETVREFLPALKRGGTHISCSTISTELARRLHALHAEHGQQFVSAPVFGRPEAAASKKLVVVAAGDVEPCRDIFDAIGRLTIIAGSEPWQANAVKLCGNFMIASMMESFGEAFAVLRKAEVDPHVFLDAMNALFASPVYANYGRMIADMQSEPAGFALKLGLKDVRFALETARECNAPMPIASILRDQFLAATAMGLSEADWSAVTRVSARNAGL